MWGNKTSSIPSMPDAPVQRRHAGHITAQSELAVGYNGDDYILDGSGTINSLPSMAVGVWVFLRCSGAPTFVNSAKLLCPNSVNFQPVAGNVIALRSEGSGTWRVLASPAIYDVLSLTSAQQDQARQNIGVIGRNKIKNGGFTINQRAYVSAATLAAAAYGHDRWKGGASGGNYSYSQLASPTTINIAANKSLIHVIEDKDVEGGSYTLSWTGTAVGRVTINNAIPSGTFAVSPITVTGQTAGTTMSVEFTGANAVGGSSVGTNTGTLGAVQLEAGTKATPFDFRLYSAELALCQRYGELVDNFIGKATTSTTVEGIVNFKVPKRIAPTPSMVNGTNGILELGVAIRSFTAVGGTSQISSAYITLTSSGLTAPNMVISYGAGILFFDCEL